jgi:rare lipoprotein A
MNDSLMTAAHRSLPFGTKLRVTHGDRSVVVTINDRGPFIRGRVLDLSTGAARAIGLTHAGVGRVVAEVM